MRLDRSRKGQRVLMGRMLATNVACENTTEIVFSFSRKRNAPEVHTTPPDSNCESWLRDVRLSITRVSS